MRKKVCCFMLVILLCSLCFFKEHSEIKRFIFTESLRSDNTHFILEEDKDLNLIKKHSINSGHLGTFNYPVETDEGVYFLSCANLTYPSSVVFYNKKQNMIKQYMLDYNALSFTVDEEYIYTVGTSDKTILTKINLLSEEDINIELDSMYVYSITVDTKNLYLFGRNSLEENMSLYIFDKQDLNQVKKIDLSHVGKYTFDTIIFNNKIYFSCMEAANNPQNGCIGVYDINNGKESVIPLQIESAYQLVLAKEKLLVTHFDPVNQLGNKISVINIKNYEISMFELSHGIRQIAIVNNRLFVLGDDNYFYIYNLKNKKMIEKKQLEQENEQSLYMNFYILE